MSDTLEKLQTLYELLNLRCDGCGELGEVSVKIGDMTLTNTAKHYGVKDTDQWEEKVSSLEKWVSENPQDVLKELPNLKNTSYQFIEYLLDITSDSGDVELIDSKEFDRVMSSEKSVVSIVVFTCEDEKCVKGDSHTHYFKSI